MQSPITSLVLLSLLVGAFSAPTLSGQIKSINDGPLASYFTKYPGWIQLSFLVICFGAVLRMLRPRPSEHMFILQCLHEIDAQLVVRAYKNRVYSGAVQTMTSTVSFFVPFS
jgi:hypothetical protein